MSETTMNQQPSAQPAEAPSGTPKPKRTPAQRRRLRRRIIKGACWTLVLAGAAAGGLWYYNSTQQTTADANTIQYAQAYVQQGPMDVYVYGTGTIAAANQPTVYAQADGTLTDLRVSVGDAVTEGQILAVLQNDALDAEITTLEYDLWAADNTITTTSAGSDVSTIMAPSAGRVMQISAAVGDDALAVYRRFGSVAMLSTDGRMKIQLLVAEDVQLAYGDTVTVVGEGFSVEGSVTDLYLQGTRATITIVDDTLPMNAQVTVKTAEDAIIGEGVLEINKPMAVSAFGGTIKAVRVKVGDKVDRKDTLFTLEDSPITLKVENLRIQRETAAEALESARAKRENLIIRAPSDGVIATVDATAGADIVSGDAVCSILQGEDMVLTIAVDELDVVNVAEGQSVTLSVDALPDLTLTGTVQRIAPVGTSSSGVSTYDVKLSFDSAGTGVRPGMNASGQVQVAHADATLYIPVEALMTMGGGQYVLVSDGGSTQTNMGLGAPAFAGTSSGDGTQSAIRQRPQEGSTGIDALTSGRQRNAANLPNTATANGGPATTGSLRAVTTGLVNDDYVEIVSGLSAGEVVLYQNSSSSSTGNQNMVRGTTMAMPMMGF